MKQTLGAIALVGALLAACGGGSATTSAADVSRELASVVATVRADASRGDVSGATSELQHLRAQVLQLRADRRLSSSDATRILDAASQVDADLPLAAGTSAATNTATNAPTMAPTTTTSTTIPTPVTTAHRRRHGKHPKAAG